MTRNKQTRFIILCISTILWLGHQTAEKSESSGEMNSDRTNKPNKLYRLQEGLPEGSSNTATKGLYPKHQMKRPKHISQLQMDIFQLKKCRYLEDLCLNYFHSCTIFLLIPLRFSGSTQWSSPESRRDNYMTITHIHTCKAHKDKESSRISYDYAHRFHFKGLKKKKHGRLHIH